MLHFTKVHGNGNDFIVLDNREPTRNSAELARCARSLCRRKFSVGADGLLVLEKSKEADFSMRVFNADGSEGEMCGNGARALARYAFEKGLAGASQCFSTPAGLMRAQVAAPYVELDMGKIDLARGVFGQCIQSHGLEFPFVFLTVGVPHCVLFAEEYDALDVASKVAMGRAISQDRARFPQGCNVSFAQVTARSAIKAVTYERGVEDLTESCGTGSVAVAVAGAIVRDCLSPVQVLNPGGTNEVRLIFEKDNTACHAYLKGRTALVASGEIHEEAWL